MTRGAGEKQWTCEIVCSEQAVHTVRKNFARLNAATILRRRDSPSSAQTEHFCPAVPLRGYPGETCRPDISSQDRRCASTQFWSCKVRLVGVSRPSLSYAVFVLRARACRIGPFWRALGGCGHEPARPHARPKLAMASSACAAFPESFPRNLSAQPPGSGAFLTERSRSPARPIEILGAFADRPLEQ